MLLGIIRSHAENSQAVFEPSGFASIEAGQIVKGSYDQTEFTHTWLQKAIAHFGLQAALNERVSVNFDVECWMTYSSPQLLSLYAGSEPRFRIKSLPQQSFLLDRAEGVYTAGSRDRALVQIGVGYFPFKYDPDAKNLGEYLFRSGTYPGYLSTVFDFPMSRLLGLRISGDLFSWLHQDLLLTSEAEMYPLQDYSLTYIVSGKAGSVLEAGGGISFARLWPVNAHATTPDTMNAIVVNGDTTGYYTFRGIKLMALISFDPKALFVSDVFGKNDLRLYSEAAVLGVKNYPVYYNDLLQRLPVMMGFNVPAFKLLDVLSLEVEWYDSRYPDSYYNEYIMRIPQPVMPPDANYAHNDWKWTVYAKKTFAGHVCLIGQAANDHIRTLTLDPLKQDREETLVKPGHWYYMVKTQFSF